MILNGKTIVIVGAAGRIGQEIVSAALKEGANVMAVDHEAKSIDALRQRLEYSPALGCQVGDITDATSVASVLQNTIAHFGSLDGAVNAAYPRNANYGRGFLDVTYADFCENLALHLGGYFLFMQQCAKHAIGRDISFSMVNMSSVYGVMAPRFEVYAGTPMTMPVEYAAIKSGLIHLTKYANVFAKGSRFRANCVSPGGIFAGQDPSFLERYNAHCRGKGMLDARDTLGAVLFLLSDAAEFVVGPNIVVDDGFSL